MSGEIKERLQKLENSVEDKMHKADELAKQDIELCTEINNLRRSAPAQRITHLQLTCAQYEDEIASMAHDCELAAEAESKLQNEINIKLAECQECERMLSEICEVSITRMQPLIALVSGAAQAYNAMHLHKERHDMALEELHCQNLVHEELQNQLKIYGASTDSNQNKINGVAQQQQERNASNSNNKQGVNDIRNREGAVPLSARSQLQQQQQQQQQCEWSKRLLRAVQLEQQAAEMQLNQAEAEYQLLK